MSRLATVLCRADAGMHAPLVRVEVHIAGGLPGMTIVGLPEAAVRESKDRVRAALQSSGFSLPPSRITINLAPADLPKQGSRFDLAMALGILRAAGQLEVNIDHCECAAELSLDGQLRPVRGLLPIALACAQAGRVLIASAECGPELRLVDDLRTHLASSLLEVCAGLRGEQAWQPLAPTSPAQPPHFSAPDLTQVHGQPLARRALEIAAAGGHHLLLFGPPGSGKSLLASCLPGLLPPLTQAQSLELACVQSLTTEGFRVERFGLRPFRNPHHTSSAVALVGGGRPPRPGEISLASHGVLCLDEMAEFPRAVLDSLREPLECGQIRIARAGYQADFPAGFQLVGTLNPCPCGYLGDAQRECRCTSEQVQRYRSRISGPLLDRIDLQVQVQRPPAAALFTATAAADSSACVAARVAQARTQMLQRQGRLNAQLAAEHLQTRVDAASQRLLQNAMHQWQLSPRAVHRVLRVARTIADLAHRPEVTVPAISEALGYRQFERTGT